MVKLIYFVLMMVLQAYDVCTRRSLTRERVFILGRMGNAREALSLIITQLKDMEEVSLYISERVTQCYSLV